MNNLYIYMTLQQLEYVVAVAEHRHFLKAAEACDVTQPTLSSMVQKLEEELGVKIFNRRIKPIALTPVGETIVAQARQTLVQAQRLKSCVDEAQHKRYFIYRCSSHNSSLLNPSFLSRVLTPISRCRIAYHGDEDKFHKNCHHEWGS